MSSRKSNKVKVKLDPSWHSRRLVVRLTLLSCLGLVVYSMLLGTQMAAIVFPPIAILSGSIVGAYVFGASYERVNGVQSLNEYSSYSESRSEYTRDREYTRHLAEPSSSSVNLITAALASHQRNSPE